MANYRVDAIGSSSQPHGIPSSTNFIDHERSAYFVELEEALMQEVAGVRTESTQACLTSRPPTLEIFPSWPMRFLHTAKGNSQGEVSSGSGSSAHNTSCNQDSDSPVSRKVSVDRFIEIKKTEMLITNQGGTQEKVYKFFFMIIIIILFYKTHCMVSILSSCC